MRTFRQRRACWLGASALALLLAASVAPGCNGRNGDCPSVEVSYGRFRERCGTEVDSPPCQYGMHCDRWVGGTYTCLPGCRVPELLGGGNADCDPGSYCDAASATCRRGCRGAQECPTGQTCDTHSARDGNGFCRDPLESEMDVCHPSGCCVMNGVYALTLAATSPATCDEAFAGASCVLVAAEDTCELTLKCNTSSTLLRGGHVGADGSYSYAIPSASGGAPATCQVQFWRGVPRFEVECTGVGDGVACFATGARP